MIRYLRKFLAAILRVVFLLERIHAILDSLRPRINLAFKVVPKDTTEGSPSMPAITPIQVDLLHDVLYATSPVDAAGAPTIPVLVWASSDPAVAEILASPDGLGALLVTKTAGVCTVSVTDGNITDSQEVTVVAAGPGPAVALNLAATVVPKA